MTDQKPDTRQLVNAEQLKEVSNALWQTLNIMVACNNKFIEVMQASETLGPADQEAVRQWSAAMAKAHQHVTDTAERMNARQAGAPLN